jgi:hypothetical protein
LIKKAAATGGINKQLLRGGGKSEGSCINTWWHNHEAVSDWIYWLAKRVRDYSLQDYVGVLV